MTEKERWWKKHTLYKSDPIVEMVEKSPEEFMISRTEILQLVMDFKTLKNKFTNICFMKDVDDELQMEWEALSDEERAARKAEAKKLEDEIKKLFED
jgi:hypothetical protein